MSPRSHSNVPYLSRRAVVPVAIPEAESADIPDMRNVQGDIYYMFPKRYERFKFFKITNTTKFRLDLDTYYPRVTSSDQTKKDLETIDANPGANMNITSNGIGFTKAGLKKLDIRERLGDIHFDQGSLVNERDALGDMASYIDAFKADGANHGVFIICSGSEESCRKESEAIQNIFKGSIIEVENLQGRIRPGDGEHFGWKDGISQPALEGLGQARPGQRVVKPGVIILGYSGDPVIDAPQHVARPSWTKDGSFMVFRFLEQNVLFFEDYIEENWRSIPPSESGDRTYLTDEERKKLFGARMVGRFKSGVPLALSPYIEDLKYLHPDLINNFNYTETYGRCPFFAHIRKTAPREMGPYLSEEFINSSVIVRAGIPYGPEITSNERQDWRKKTFEEKINARCDRGLLFACYQSSIHNGFFRQTTGFANNDFFPPTSLVPKKIGQDPIIGGPKAYQTPENVDSKDFQGEVPDKAKTFYSENFKLPKTAKQTDEFDVLMRVKNKDGEEFDVAGIAKKILPSATDYEQQFFVTSQGGDYYFMPSLSTLRRWGAKRWHDN